MTYAPPVPHMVRSTLDEHRALRALLRQIESAIERPAPHTDRGPDVVAARLDALRGPLRAHFDEEERGHLFEEIEELAPDQAPACARLRGEHEGLLGRLDSLRQASPVERRYAAWAREVRTFLDDLSGHEERETELLTRTLDGGPSAQD